MWEGPQARWCNKEPSSSGMRPERRRKEPWRPCPLRAAPAAWERACQRGGRGGRGAQAREARCGGGGVAESTPGGARLPPRCGGRRGEAPSACLMRGLKKGKCHALKCNLPRRRPRAAAAGGAGWQYSAAPRQGVVLASAQARARRLLSPFKRSSPNGEEATRGLVGNSQEMEQGPADWAATTYSAHSKGCADARVRERACLCAR
jgi:hypothetical protein